MKKKENMIVLANDGFITVEDTGKQKPGMIAFANEDRFQSAHFSEPLTAYAAGWDDPENIQATLDIMAPPIPVARRFEFKKAINSESFLSETDEIRGIGASFKRVSYEGESQNEKTLNKGLTIRLDHDEMTEGSQEQAVSRLLKRLARNDLRRTVTLIINNSTNSNKTWDLTAAKDPDMDVVSDLDTGADARGMMSNLVVYGQSAWINRLKSYRAQDLAGQSISSTLTPDQVAQFLQVDKVMVSKERYQSTKTTKTKIVGDFVLMYMAEQNISKDDPSDIKQFWSPTDAGKVKVYVVEHEKFTDVTVEHYSNIVMTGNIGVRRFTVTGA